MRTLILSILLFIYSITVLCANNGNEQSDEPPYNRRRINEEIERDRAEENGSLERVDFNVFREFAGSVIEENNYTESRTNNVSNHYMDNSFNYFCVSSNENSNFFNSLLNLPRRQNSESFSSANVPLSQLPQSSSCSSRTSPEILLNHTENFGPDEFYSGNLSNHVESRNFTPATTVTHTYFSSDQIGVDTTRPDIIDSPSGPLPVIIPSNFESNQRSIFEIMRPLHRSEEMGCVTIPSNFRRSSNCEGKDYDDDEGDDDENTIYHSSQYSNVSWLVTSPPLGEGIIFDVTDIEFLDIILW